jgi:hypothetical protein
MRDNTHIHIDIVAVIKYGIRHDSELVKPEIACPIAAPAAQLVVTKALLVVRFDAGTKSANKEKAVGRVAPTDIPHAILIKKK